jgi:hypothetical protein
VKRLAAALAAVAMVAGAWLLRGALDADDADGGNGGREVPEQLRLMCATELDDICRVLADEVAGVELTVEDPGVTADALSALAAGDDPGFDAWLADGPWAAMVADDRTFAGVDGEVLGTPSGVLGRSPAVIVVQSSRRAELDEACGGAISWRCIGEQATTLRVGMASPDRGDGLVTLAEATGSFFDTTDYSTVDFEEPGFTAWFDSLTRLSTSQSVRLGERSALEAAVGQAGTFNVVGALESQAATLLRDRDDWSTIYPEPMSTADVQLVPRDGLDADELLDRLGAEQLRDALLEGGFRSATDQDDQSTSLPPEANLPSAGVLNALRDLW